MIGSREKSEDWKSKKGQLVCSCLPIDMFNSIEREWDELNAKRSRIPILDVAFVRLLLRFFGDGNEVILHCKSGGKTVALGILIKKRPGIWQTFQPSQAPIGIWLQESGRKFEEILESAKSVLGQICLVLGVTQQDPEIVERPAESGNLRTLDYINTAKINVTGGFDDYWGSRGKNLRHTLRRQRNKLAREGITTRLECLTAPEDMERAVNEYGVLESRGWKGTKGTALQPGNVQGRFYSDCLKHYAAKGEAIAYRYWYGGKLVASDLCLSKNGTMIILKTTYDEEQRSTSPAMLMRQESFEEIFEGKTINSIEFYGRAMDWHRKWTDDIKVMYHVNYYRWEWIANWSARDLK